MEKGPYEMFRVLLRFQYLDGGEDDESWLLGKNAKDALNSRGYSIVLLISLEEMGMRRMNSYKQ